MKKLYSFVTLAALGCLVSFAGQRYQAASFKIATAKAELSVKAADLTPEAEKPFKAPAKAAAAADFNGTYDWAYENLLNGDGPEPELVITIDNEATGAATITGLPMNFKLAATVDVAAGTVSIANMQSLGKDSYGDENYFYLKTADSQGKLVAGASSAKATVGTIKGSNITFPVLDIWAIGDPQAESLGWYALTYANELTQQKEKVLYGTATVSGDMYFSAFGKTPADYTVDVYLDGDDETQLLVKNPIKGLYKALGWGTYVSPDMIIDTTYPDNVLIDVFSLDINGGDEDGMYYGMSQSANQQDIANTPEAYRVKMTKDAKSAVITIPERGLFIWPSNTTTLYTANKTPVTITIALAQSGISDIIADNDANAPVEFFNLQGQRVVNPTAGQLLIKRQGNTVTKVIVK